MSHDLQDFKIHQRDLAIYSLIWKQAISLLILYQIKLYLCKTLCDLN